MISPRKIITHEKLPTWRIDKSIPLALVTTMILQLFGFIYWAGRLSVRFENLEQMKMEQEEKIASLSRMTLNIERSLNKIEDKMEIIASNWGVDAQYK